MSADREIAQIGRAMKLERQTKRAELKAENTAALIALGIPFESKNFGAHLIVNGWADGWDFWPSTGRWCSRARGHGVKLIKGFGLRALVAAMERDRV